MELIKTPCQDRLTYVFDLDGVIYRGTEPQPHARELVSALRSQGHLVRFYTNNSALSRRAYSEKLERLGIPTPVEEIMTSSYATALYFVEKNAAGKTVYRIGEQGLYEELQAVGMKVIYDMDEPDAHIDYVVVGIDREFNYSKLTRAMRAILDGAGFIATNGDTRYPVENTVVPGNGCLVAAVKTATSVEPFLVGKPHTYALDKILELAGSTPECAIMVGDNLATDIAVGNRAGLHSVLVLTGLSTREDAAKAVGDMKPDRIIDTLAELL